MGYIVDFLIVIICASVMVNAWKNGLVKSVMSLVTGVVAFVVSYTFSQPLADWICVNFALEPLVDSISKTISSLSENAAGTFDLASMFEEMPDALKQIIERYSVDVAEFGQMCSGRTGESHETVEMISEYIASPVAETISAAIAFVLIFVLSVAALKLITWIIDMIFHLPVLKGVNKFFGLLFGAGEAVILAFLISSVSAAIILALGSIDPANFGAHVIERSFIMKTLASIKIFG